VRSAHAIRPWGDRQNGPTGRAKMNPCFRCCADLPMAWAWLVGEGRNQSPVSSIGWAVCAPGHLEPNCRPFPADLRSEAAGFIEP